MTVEELKGVWPDVESRLEAADILLIHARGGLVSKGIQRKTGSYWNHTALVFMPKRELLIGGPLIVEAGYGGIEIHQMKRYADRFDHYDFGIKRFPNLTDEQRRKIVMSFVLSNVDVGYDFSRLAAYFISPIIQKISMKLWPKLFRSATHQDSFICTTFVHKAFHAWMNRHQVSASFIPTKDAATRTLEIEELITPADIAADPIFEWVFNPNA